MGNKKKNNSKSNAAPKKEIPAPPEKKPGKLSVVLHILLLFISSLALTGGIYVSITYPNEKLEELLFYATNGADNSGAGPIIVAAVTVTAISALITAALTFIQYRKIEIKRKGKEPLRLFPKYRWLVSAILCVVFICVGLANVGFFRYIRTSVSSSEFFELHYVHPEDTEITAPENKRNILVIELESFETTLFTKEQGGIWEFDVMPELYELLGDEDAIFFASDDNVKGIESVFGSTWTTASLIANTAGLPFKVPFEMNNGYYSDNFLHGAYALGDILEDNGYRNVVISGSVTSFGGIGDYFKCHGDYDIIDGDSVEKHGFVLPESQENEWGFSDEANFKFAQDVIADLETETTPWHLLISTIDTHFSGYGYEADEEYGYEGSEKKFDRALNNYYATTARETVKFIKWLKEQDCYENTTVVIFGDHNNMLGSFCDEKYDDIRGRYNVILNSVVSTDNVKNRSFTAFDFYPTTLAAAGFEIDGERLGLGTNLFSDTKTISEKFGLDVVNEQLELRSDFYVNEIMGEDEYADLEERSQKKIEESIRKAEEESLAEANK